jgi:uncharacterized membrane protein YhaH (DUF805 family)
MSQFCTKCGAENQDDARFCRSCGSALNRESNSPINNTAEPRNLPNEVLLTDQEASFAKFHYTAKGRVGRKEFFFRWFMPYITLLVGLTIGANLIIMQETESSASLAALMIILLVIVVLFFSQVVIGIKRLHDINASGWWSLLWFVPLANFILLLVLFFKPSSTSTVQKFGTQVGRYTQTPLRWVLFVIQLIFFLVLLPVMTLTTAITENETPNNQSLFPVPVDSASVVDTVSMSKDIQLFQMPVNTNEGKHKGGLIDRQGNWIVQPIYDYIGDFSEGLAEVKLGNKWGFIDKQGNLVIQPIYDEVSDFNEGLARVRFGDFLKGKYGFIDKKGNLVIQPIYSRTMVFSEGLAAVSYDEFSSAEDFLLAKMGFIDKQGNLVIQPTYRGIKPFSEGLARVLLAGKWGFMDKKGNLVIQPIYDMVNSFSEGLAKVLVDGKWGFIDKQGNLVIEPIYGDASFLNGVDDFHEGLASVRFGDRTTGKYGFIDKQGNLVIQPKYSIAFNFSEGLAIVKFGDILTGKYGFIDKQGNIIIAPIYDSVEVVYREGYLVKKDGQFLYINKQGNVVAIPKPYQP